MRQLFHDAYARFTLNKEPFKTYGSYRCCTTCGSPGKQYKNHSTLYRFHTVNDDSLHGNRNEIAHGKLFCCVSCMRQYTR